MECEPVLYMLSHLLELLGLVCVTYATLRHRFSKYQLLFDHYAILSFCQLAKVSETLILIDNEPRNKSRDILNLI